MGKVKLNGEEKKSYVPWNQNFKLLQTSILMLLLLLLSRFSCVRLCATL